MKQNLLSFATIFLLGTGVSFTQTNLVWAKAMGGTGQNEGHSIACDASGNVYTSGKFYGTVDFDPGAGTYNLTASNDDIFISKLDAAGNFVWAKAFGGTGWDNSTSVALDASGNVYTTGRFENTVDFDPGAGTFNLTSAGTIDIFISKLDASGNFVWAKAMGGTDADIVHAMVLDDLGNIYTTGRFLNTADFDPGAGIFNLTAANNSTFISKLDASGNFVWAKILEGTTHLESWNIALDASGNVYTTGLFWGTSDFDPGAGIFNLTSAGVEDIFISKLDAAGNFVWAKSMGGSGFDSGFSIAIDATGNVYTTGVFGYTVDFDPGAGNFNLSSSGNFDIFISKLDASGNFVWAKTMGGADAEMVYAMVLDASGNVYTTGTFQNTADFNPGTGISNLNAGDGSIFISKLDASGNFIWVNSIGGSAGFSSSITLDASGNILTTGGFNGTADFDPGMGIFNLTSLGSIDIFIHKMTNFSVGLIENDLANEISVFPNPSNGIFQLNFKNEQSFIGTLEIYNAIGEKVYAESNIEEQMQIDLSAFSKGIYYLEIISATKNYYQKIIVQ